MRLIAGMAIIAFAAAMVHSCAHAQVPGAPGRTTSPGSTSTSFYTPSLGTITCSGTTCTYTSGTVSPSSQAVSGTLAFNSSQDAGFTVGGPMGGGAGQMQVSCDGGTTWLPLAVGSGSIGGSVSYYYPTSHCTGVTNLNSLQFRSYLTGGGGTGFNMSFTAPSSVTITW
jgi:hypothetical protein